MPDSVDYTQIMELVKLQVHRSGAINIQGF